MESYIQISHVRKRFGEDLVLKDINLTMERGKAYGIVGNNGSGKTVLMKCICGFLPVSTGRILVDGREIGKDVDFPESLGIIIETPGFLGHLSGRKNLEILADLNRKIKREDITRILCRVGLNPGLKKPVAKYSLGMRQRLGIAQALLEQPELLILDEPFNGLDEQGVAEIRKLLLEEKEKGRTLLLSSHNKEDIQVLCDQVIRMDGGEVKEEKGYE